MCRAIWVLVVAPDDEACKHLRRASGVDVQVVGMATSLTDLEALGETPADAVVVWGMAEALEGVRARWPEAAVVWVGDGAPDDATAVGADGLADALPGAITRALIARR